MRINSTRRSTEISSAGSWAKAGEVDEQIIKETASSEESVNERKVEHLDPLKGAKYPDS